MVNNQRTSYITMFAKYIPGVVALLLCLPVLAHAQEIRTVVVPDGHAYIYHDQLLALGHGFNVYRESEGEAERLNEEPVYPANSGADFQHFLNDELYRDIREAMDLAAPQEIFLRLRGDEFERNILAFSFPDIARAMGMLFVDENPVLNTEVTYRFELVNQRGEPTGREFESSLVVEQVELTQPEVLNVTREGAEITVEWNYLDPTEDGVDPVVRFDIFMKPDDEESFRRVTERSQLRLLDETEFTYSFTLEDEYQTAEFTVEGIDATGENRIAADPVEVELIDERKPLAVEQVFSTIRNNGVDLTWPVSTDPNVVGYYVDRINAETEDSIRLNEEMISLTEPEFRDETIVAGYDFYYYVKAVSETGVESEQGNPAIENIIEVHHPDPPAELSASVDEEEGLMELEWQGVEQDDLFNTYIVLRRKYEDGEKTAFSQVNSGRLTENTIIDDGVAGEGFTEGIFYEYGVTVANQQGMRSDTIYTIVQMPVVTPPAPPAGLEASVDRGVRINLNWAASPSPDVTSYNLYKVTEAQDTSVVNHARGNRFASDDEVVAGNDYLYFTTAVDSAGNESEPTPAEEIMMKDDSPPASIRNLQAIEMDDGVNLRWEASSSEDVVGYFVERASLRNGQYETLHDEPLDDVNWIDENGETGKWYRVYAVDTSGNKSRPGTPRQATYPD